jgi:hypothetical protein
MEAEPLNPVSAQALVSAHHAATVLAACTGGALLVANPERYLEWAGRLGCERARVQLVDWLSRAGRFFGDLGSGIWEASENLIELDMPIRCLLVQTVSWNGIPPVPDGLTAAAQSLVPLLGVAQRDPNGFDALEAPTIPTPKRSNDALESLDEELVDESSEVRLLVEQLVETSQLDAALVSYRSGATVAQAGCGEMSGKETVLTNPEVDTTPLIADLLETSDLFFFLRLHDALTSVRMTGVHAMLVGAGPTRQSVECLRAPGIGYTLDHLLQSFHSRLDRMSSTVIPGAPTEKD